MSEIQELPIQSEIEVLSTIEQFQQIVSMNLEFFTDALINPGSLRPQEEYEIEEY
jgi:hypothetical protein